MMPVGTPPNAIAYSSGYIKMNDMIKYGFVMNIISGIIIIIFGFLFL
jgi:sodium-dependent dicarboxylate transporter 2/3/5